MMLLEITGYSLLEEQGESEDALGFLGLPVPPLARAAPPLQPGHTQVAVVTAPESLGKRVVLNFQLCDLSEKDTQSGWEGKGQVGLVALLP